MWASEHGRLRNNNRTRGVICAVTTSEKAPALTIYSTTWCGYCRRLKTQLNASGIEYTEIDIENDPSAAEFVGSVNDGNHIVPTVKYADGSVATNPSLNQVKQALGL
nr:mycoredoxin [Rhodococcus sp. MS16]